MTGEEVVVEGEYTVKGEQLTLTDKQGRLACTGEEGIATATYKWKYEGESLTLSKVEDKMRGSFSGADSRTVEAQEVNRSNTGTIVLDLPALSAVS